MKPNPSAGCKMNQGATSNRIAKSSAESRVGPGVEAEPHDREIERRVGDPDDIVEDPADRRLAEHMRGCGD